MKVYRALYPDRIKKSSDKYFRSHKELTKIRGARYYSANKERCLKVSAARHAIHREKDNAYLREYRKKNKDRIKDREVKNRDTKRVKMKNYALANPAKVAEQRARSRQRNKHTASAFVR